MSTTRTTILADPDLLDRVDRHARLNRTTKTAVITAAIEAYLERHAVPAPVSFVAVGRSSHGRLSLDTRRIVDREVGSRQRGAGG
jgi:hypothetical protein